MALDLYFKDDLRRILDSKEQAARDMMRPGPAYQGYMTALAHLRTEFGLNESQPVTYDLPREMWLKTNGG